MVLYDAIMAIFALRMRPMKGVGGEKEGIYEIYYQMGAGA
jgi:hypothetical protein